MATVWRRRQLDEAGMQALVQPNSLAPALWAAQCLSRTLLNTSSTGRRVLYRMEQAWQQKAAEGGS